VPYTSSIASPKLSRLVRQSVAIRSGGIARATVFLLAILVALISYRYVLGLPPVPDIIALNRFRTFWLVLHVGFASTALLLGVVQFSKVVRERRPSVHRWTGRVYVVSCIIGGISGLVLAAGTSAGPIAGAGFGSLSVLWIITNALGWQRALTRDFASHRRWMIRSWALTLAAVTLRIYIPLFEIAEIPELPAYRAISFLCWAPNLLAAEILVRRQHRKRQVPDAPGTPNRWEPHPNRV
jgi:uncharacterized membrane protein